jgi:ketosteroid isomerase-like protein
MDALTRTLQETIEAADRAITTEDFDELMKFYADDASLVVKPGMIVAGKESIRRCFCRHCGAFQ